MKRTHAGFAIASIVCLAVGGVATLARAQEPAPAAPPATATPPAAEPAPAGKPKKDTPPAQPAPDASRKPASAQGSPQHFEPTEKVRPDFDVAFPVDI
jgi:hypothetical protein